MLRSGGLLDRVLDVGSIAARRAAVADVERSRRSCASSTRPRVDVRRSAGAHAARARSAAAGDRAGELPEPGPDRVGPHPPGRGARQRHHPLARPIKAADRPRAGRSRSRATVRATRCRIAWSRIRRWSSCSIEHRPVLVIAANPGLVFSEVPLLRTARRRGVRSMAIDPSWDNFTNKLIPVRQVDRLVVWNDIMKEQAIGAARLPSRRDPRRRRAAVRSALPRAHAARASSSARIGADPARKLIALTTTPRSLYSHHDHVLRVLVAAMHGGALADAQVLVRLHPRDEFDAYARVRGRAARDHREAVPRHREGGRRPGHRRDARAPAAPRRHAVPRRRRRQRRLDDQHRGVHLRHAGREHLLRRSRRESRT